MGNVLRHDHGNIAAPVLWALVRESLPPLDLVCREADILVAAIGRAKFVKASMVKAGAVVIDVGINRDDAGKLCGDVDFAAVQSKASAITPVPGGVGTVTSTVLIRNVVRAASILGVSRNDE